MQYILRVGSCINITFGQLRLSPRHGSVTIVAVVTMGVGVTTVLRIIVGLSIMKYELKCMTMLTTRAHEFFVFGVLECTIHKGECHLYRDAYIIWTAR